MPASNGELSINEFFDEFEGSAWADWQREGERPWRRTRKVLLPKEVTYNLVTRKRDPIQACTVKVLGEVQVIDTVEDQRLLPDRILRKNPPQHTRGTTRNVTIRTIASDPRSTLPGPYRWHIHEILGAERRETFNFAPVDTFKKTDVSGPEVSGYRLLSDEYGFYFRLSRLSQTFREERAAREVAPN